MSALITGLIVSGRLLPPDRREGRAMVRAALDAGEPPPGARGDAWRRLLAKEVRELRKSRWTGVLLLLVALLARLEIG